MGIVTCYAGKQIGALRLIDIVPGAKRTRLQARHKRSLPAPGTPARRLFDLIIESRRPGPEGLNHQIVIREALEIVLLAQKHNTIEQEIELFRPRISLRDGIRGSAAALCMARGEA
jgi:hypothetical protein